MPDAQARPERPWRALYLAIVPFVAFATVGMWVLTAAGVFDLSVTELSVVSSPLATWVLVSARAFWKNRHL